MLNLSPDDGPVAPLGRQLVTMSSVPTPDQVRTTALSSAITGVRKQITNVIVCVMFTHRRCVDHLHDFRYRPKLGAARQVLGVVGAFMTHFRAERRGQPGPVGQGHLGGVEAGEAVPRPTALAGPTGAAPVDGGNGFAPGLLAGPVSCVGPDYLLYRLGDRPYRWSGVGSLGSDQHHGAHDLLAKRDTGDRH